jgi:hypothetical protein
MPRLAPLLHRGTGLSVLRTDILSPRHLLDRPIHCHLNIFRQPGVESDLAYRFVSPLPAQKVQSYQTMDLHTDWPPIKSVRLNIAGRNVLQSHHHQFAGDNGLPVGIRRNLDAGFIWTR